MAVAFDAAEQQPEAERAEDEDVGTRRRRSAGRRATPAAATIEPTDRSMPAVAMTNVMPIASTPTTLDWVRIARKLSIVGNVSGLRIAPTTIRATITPTSVYSWNLVPRGSANRLLAESRPRRSGLCRVHHPAPSSIRRRRRSTICCVPGIAGRRTSSSVAVAPSSSATSSPSRITRIRVQRPSSSSISDDTTMHAEAVAGEVGDDADTARPSSATSTPRVGSSSSSTRQWRSSQRAEHHLLLVAARQLAGHPARRRTVSCAAAQLRLGRRPLGPDADQAALEAADVGAA